MELALGQLWISAGLHLGGSISSAFSTVAGRIFIGLLQKEERDAFTEVLLLLSETEDALLSSTFHALPSRPRTCDLG